MQERRVAVRMSAKLYKTAKVKCVEDDKSLSEVMRDLLAGWVDGSITLADDDLPKLDDTADVLAIGFTRRRKT